MKKNTGLLPLGVVYILALFAMLFWGFSFVWVKIAYAVYHPLEVVFIRLLIAAILLTIVSLFMVKEKIQKKDYKIIFLLAFFEPFCYFIGESFGMQYMTATLASIIISTIPLFTPIFSYLIIREKVTIWEITGLVISFIGVLMLILVDMHIAASLKGVLLMFFAVLAGTNYCVMLRKVADNYSAITIVKWQNIIGALLFLPLFMIFDFSHFRSIPFDIKVFANIIQLAVFASTLAFIFLTIIVRNIGVNRANIFTNLIPVYTAVLSWYLLGESFGSRKIAGIIVVIIGLFLSQVHRLDLSFKKRQK